MPDDKKEKVSKKVPKVSKVPKANLSNEPNKPNKPKKVKVSPALQKIIDQVEKLSVLELSELVKALEDKFGVTAAAPMSTGIATAGAEAGNETAQEEKSEFDVVLTAAGANKIAAIKAVRAIKPDLGLKDAKDLVDTAPKTILEAASKEQAEDAKSKLETAGAQVELK